MKIFVEKENVEKEMKFNGKVADLLVKLNINPEAVLVVRDGELLRVSDSIINSDEIRILPVISGG